MTVSAASMIERRIEGQPARLRGGYCPSPRWQSVVQTISENDPLPDTLREMVDEIATRTGETTALGSASGPFAVFNRAGHVGIRTKIRLRGAELAGR